MRYLTADWHIGDTRLALLGRPQPDRISMFTEILRNYNEVVRPDDLVEMVGDVVAKSTENPLEWLENVAKFNGRKRLYRGNHDVIFTDKQLAPYFYEIVPEGEGRYEELDGVPCYITHYPTQSVADAFNIVGHIHSSWRVQANMFNVGVDVHHFRPVAENRIKFTLDAITSFYDEDVWVADHTANAPFKGVRGKKGRYFNGISPA